MCAGEHGKGMPAVRVQYTGHTTGGHLLTAGPCMPTRYFDEIGFPKQALSARTF